MILSRAIERELKQWSMAAKNLIFLPVDGWQEGGVEIALLKGVKGVEKGCKKSG